MTRFIVIIGFMVAFAAGLTVGRRAVSSGSPAVAEPSTRSSRFGGWLTAQLGLTPDQQKQMDVIWSDTARRGGWELEQKRRGFRKERDDAIAALIRPEDRSAFDEVQKRYQDQSTAMDKDWRASFQRAVDQTNQILTPDQRTKYATILAARMEGGERGPRRGPPATSENGFKP